MNILKIQDELELLYNRIRPEYKPNRKDFDSMPILCMEKHICHSVDKGELKKFGDEYGGGEKLIPLPFKICKVTASPATMLIIDQEDKFTAAIKIGDQYIGVEVDNSSYDCYDLKFGDQVDEESRDLMMSTIGMFSFLYTQCGNHLVSVSPVKPGKSVEWVKKRSYVTLIDRSHSANDKSLKDKTDVVLRAESSIRALFDYTIIPARLVF